MLKRDRILFSPRFWNRGLKQWNSMALYDTLWHYEKTLKCWFDTLWHFMELYDNQGSSTPLTAKTIKALFRRNYGEKEDHLNLFNSGLFFLPLWPTAEAFIAFLAPTTRGTPRTARQSLKILKFSPNPTPLHICIYWLVYQQSRHYSCVFN